MTEDAGDIKAQEQTSHSLTSQVLMRDMQKKTVRASLEKHKEI